MYNKQMDGLRCFAVLGVLTFHFIHFNNVFLSRIPFGHGVNLFFVISGFFITRILIENKQSIDKGSATIGSSLKVFYARRTIRIFPIYYITLFFLFIINFQNTRSVFGWLVSYTTNIYLSLGKPYIGSFNHLWSLGVEEQFYLLWPLLIFLTPIKRIKLLIYSTIFISVIFKTILYLTNGYGDALNAFTFSCADALGLGALVAYWSIYKPEISNKINGIRFIVLLSFLPFAFFMIYPRNLSFMICVFGNFLFATFGFFVVIKASQEKFTHFMKLLLENPVSLHIGKISYGIYLYHLFMPDLYNLLGRHIEIFSGDAWFRRPVYFITTILIAEFSWWIIEKPILNLKKYFKYKNIIPVPKEIVNISN